MSPRSRRLRWCAAALLVAASGGCVGGSATPPAAVSASPRAEISPSGRPTPSAGGLPGSMAALGDSITRAFLVCGINCPQSSWATGSSEGLGSHSQRLAQLRGAAIDSHNLAVIGTAVSALVGQASEAVGLKVGYVTILIGANDACASTEDAMTSVAQYAAAFDQAMTTLTAGLPAAKILVVSIPDLQKLWRVGKDRAEVRATWERFGICQAMLADPLSAGGAAAGRRERVRNRVIAYNRAMAASCARHPTCRWDNSAVFNHQFALADVSRADYWHPSLSGQRRLAAVTWRAGYWP